MRTTKNNVKHQLIAISFGLLGTAVLAMSASAQGRGGTFFTPPANSGGTFFNAPASNGFQQVPSQQVSGPVRFHGRFARRHRIYPYAGYGPYFYYPDYDYDNGPPEEAAPPAARAAAQPAVPAETPRAADSVVMELRGDHWVRLTTTGPVEVMAPVPSTARIAVLPAFDLSPAAEPLPAAILVFRDGHQEEAAKYTIVGGTIFLKSDYWSTGSWTRKVSIRDLDVPGTLKRNAERGTKFTLPSRSTEVILRP